MITLWVSHCMCSFIRRAFVDFDLKAFLTVALSNESLLNHIYDVTLLAILIIITYNFLYGLYL